jgi:putative membrane protein
MLRRSILLQAAALALGAGAGTAHAAQGSGRPIFAPASIGQARPSAPHQREERRFLQESAAQLHFAHEAARLAHGRAASERARDLAAAFIADHRAAAPRLQRLLHARGMAMPMLDNAQAKVLRQLARANGARFDRAFVQDVGVRAQVLALRQHERAAPLLQDPALRAWADERVPRLRAQLALAERGRFARGNAPLTGRSSPSHASGHRSPAWP